MTIKICALMSLPLLGSMILHSQVVGFSRDVLEPIGVSMSVERLMGEDVARATKAPTVKEFDGPTFIKITGSDFRNGTIEVKILSRLLKDAPEFSRGFIGVAFRIDDSNSQFECIYLRPTNGRADTQLRRNRSIQYFSFPDYKFERLRKEAPGEYESYADMGLNEWIKMKIEVRCNQVLLWKQPHPLFFTELDYRLHPTRATLEKWSALVEGTAEHMADYPMRDEETGIYHLEPVMPPSELGVTRDTVFDLAYWRWGLERAQAWRVRLGLPRNPQWDAIWQNLAPLPVHDGLYVHSADWLDTYTKRAWEHPDPIGVFGMLPATEGVDRETARRTVLKVWTTWDWTRRCWGWDFPWMAMAAARVGEPGLAVDALLRDAGTRNNYDQRGVCTGGPCPYLPGNGGLLYAVAMMAAGWDGAPKNERTRFPR